MCDVELDIGREFVKNGIIYIDIARSSNGRTTVSGTVNPSSNLGLAIYLAYHQVNRFLPVSITFYLNHKMLQIYFL